MLDKKSLRKDLISTRDSLSESDWNKFSKIIQRNLIKSVAYKECDCLLSYSDFHGEVGTYMLIEDALLSGKRVFLPKVLDSFLESKMEFYEIYSTGELISGYKGIMEPTGNRERTFYYDNFADKKILMTVPGVAFSKTGYRLGYGMGYYDNYLSDKERIVKCGICFSMQLMDELPITDNDIKMDIIVNENVSSKAIDDLYLNL